LTPDHYQTLDYPKHLNSPDALFRKLHEDPWDVPNEISKGFTLFKQNRHFEDFVADQAYDLVYYDAFGARVQPELWEIERFLALYKALRPHGVLVTYAAKGSVRRALHEVGFMVERLPGPPGKREMLRGTKI
ncbi:MAG: MnmC family methyltransferase, partial [Bacteroidetes bacterium]|nr:MnmC family methyltransferase [Bacteroidota bacterium]